MQVHGTISQPWLNLAPRAFRCGDRGSEQGDRSPVIVVFLAYTMLTVAYALDGKLEEAKAALAEARRLYPKLTVKLMHERYPDFPWLSEGPRRAGLPEE